MIENQINYKAFQFFRAALVSAGWTFYFCLTVTISNVSLLLLPVCRYCIGLGCGYDVCHWGSPLPATDSSGSNSSLKPPFSSTAFCSMIPSD